MTAYAVLAASAFAGQSALVVPIVPLLVSAGALAAQGHLNVGLAIVALAAGTCDTSWISRRSLTRFREPSTSRPSRSPNVTREIPRGVEVVLYCTCPDEDTSARAAVRLRRRGVTRVRPLEGGFDAWQDRDYPIEFRGPAVEEDARILNAA